VDVFHIAKSQETEHKAQQTARQENDYHRRHARMKVVCGNADKIHVNVATFGASVIFAEGSACEQVERQR
jgi:hypothetical protein